MSIWNELLFLHGHIASPHLARALAAEPDAGAAAELPPLLRDPPGDLRRGRRSAGQDAPATPGAAASAG
ncbi:hypothetical protein QFW77_06185 [Luteimonas sp. RD2P54]|uniref:Uncharacterized protein n=1 Tax=Luteimonas endophytica TaxID=3042023 RepID=A0ABT6J6X7_9GAMM|nr:hypothetical protein [Luteimonas endophytica]MDH5822579.1 hypothetical protein [Luteimonas endophytica]